MRRTTVLVLFFCLGAVPLRATAADGPDLRSGDIELRLAEAASARKSDVPALARALLELGVGDGEKEDLEFLVRYAAGEMNRALRLLAVSSAERLDKKAAFEQFAKIAKNKRNSRRAAVAAEALGYLATEEDLDSVVALLGSSSELVAVAAADALARFAPGDAVDEIVAAGLENPNEHVLAHVAWAALDARRSKSGVEGACRKAAKGRPEIEPRVAVVEKALAEGFARPWRWGKALPVIRHLAAEPPGELVGQGYNPDIQQWLDEGIAWIRKNDPPSAWLVASIFDRITAMDDAEYSRFDFKQRVVSLSLEDAGVVSDRLAVLLTRGAVRGLRRLLKEPFDDHRGFEAAYFDTYDLCDVAGIDGVGRAGGKSMEEYLKKTLAWRLWEVE